MSARGKERHREEKRVEAADIKSTTGDRGIILRSAGSSVVTEYTALPHTPIFPVLPGELVRQPAGWQTTSYNWVGPLEAAVAKAGERISVC